MSATPNLVIIILAAGGSSRMGQPKQLLPWGKTTLLGHSINQALASKAPNVIVVLGANYKDIEASIKEQPIVMLKNNDWETGMGSSIALGAKQAIEEGFNAALFMLADQPQVDHLLLNELIAKFKEAQTAKIIATDYNSNAGVPAIFHHSFFSCLLQLNGTKGAQSFIFQHLQQTVKVLTSNKIEDIDTLEQYEEMVKNIKQAGISN